MNKIKLMFLRSGPRQSKVMLGAEKIILTIAKEIDKTKFEPIIACLNDLKMEHHPLILNAQKYDISTEIINLRNKFDPSGVFKLRALLKKYQINILHCNEYKSNLIGFLATRFTNINLITTMHGWLRSSFRIRCYEFVDSLVIRFFKRIIAVSEVAKRELLNKRFHPSKITVVQTGLDTDFFKEGKNLEEIKKELEIPSGHIVIGTVGRLSAERGHRYLLEAASQINKIFPETIFLIVGDGALRGYLVNYAQELGISNKVIFTGFQENIRDYISIMDIFIFPSLRETFGIAVIEAMYLGKPVIATNVGIASEIIIDGESGILVEPKNGFKIVGGLTRLIKNRELALKMGMASKKLIEENFSSAKMVKNYEQVYLELINE